MIRNPKSRFLVVLAVSFLALATGCGRSLRPVVGTWNSNIGEEGVETTEGILQLAQPMRLQLMPDGTFRFSPGNLTGTYMFDGKAVTLKPSQVNGSVLVGEQKVKPLALSGDGNSLRDLDGGIFDFSKRP